MQVINKRFPSDPKNMNISDDFKRILDEAIAKLKEKKPRAKKVNDPNEPPKAKKEAKPRAKKEQIRL